MKKFFVVFALIFVSSMLFADNSDEMACKFARKVGTVDVWKNYLETYPGGSCAFEAESFMKMNKQATPRDLEANNPQDVNACAMARQKNRPDVWRIYLESYPHGICAFEAKMAITELEEKAKAEQAAAAAAAAANREASCDAQNRTFPCKDNTTGLTWSRRAPNEMTWMNALNYCEDLSEGGYNDWRLPNIDELRTIIKNCPKTVPYGACQVSERNGCLSNSCWNPSGSCYCSDGGRYSRLGDPQIRLWSSSTGSDGTDRAWIVYFKNGNVFDNYKSYSYYVRCVR